MPENEDNLDPIIQWFDDVVERQRKIEKMDNRELLWWLMRSKVSGFPLDSIESALLEEVSNRLYPEFDGEKVVWMDYGWQTPEGEIRYL
jgi:hypothetical protein